MNKQLDKSLLLATLSKKYVFTELGIRQQDFSPTADSAWVQIAAKLLKTAALKKPVSSKR